MTRLKLGGFNHTLVCRRYVRHFTSISTEGGRCLYHSQYSLSLTCVFVNFIRAEVTCHWEKTIFPQASLVSLFLLSKSSRDHPLLCIGGLDEEHGRLAAVWSLPGRGCDDGRKAGLASAVCRLKAGSLGILSPQDQCADALMAGRGVVPWLLGRGGSYRRTLLQSRAGSNILA